MSKKTFGRMREYVAGVPVVDCHDHAGLRAAQPDVLAHLAAGYFGHDLESATSTAEMEFVRDANRRASRSAGRCSRRRTIARG